MVASGDVNSVYDTYGKSAEFLFIYIREAHPLDGWKMSNSRINDPVSMEEREAAAKTVIANTKLKFTTLIDGMDDTVCVKYAAWPNRLFVVDKEGKISYSGRQGPGGYWPTERYCSKKAPGESLMAYLEKLFAKK